MGNGARILTIPRHNPINAITMGGIVRDAVYRSSNFANYFDLVGASVLQRFTAKAAMATPHYAKEFS